jgi:hypothetical protein
MKTLVLFLFAICICIYAKQCEFEQLEVTTADAVDKCLKQIPFVQDVRTKTIEHLKKLYQFYVYRDISLNSTFSDSPFAVSVDVDAELDKILKKTYDKDYSFQQDVANTFLSLKDPHTVYTKPVCYGFGYFIPFTFTSKYNADGEQHIYIAPLPEEYSQLENDYYKAFPNAEQSKDYLGWRVVEIDNQDAMTELKEFADKTVAYSRDVQIRFNYALKQDWSIRIALHTPVPSPHHYTIINEQTRNTKTIEWKWAAKSLIESKDTEQLINNYCGYSVSTSSIQTTQEPMESKVMDKEYEEILNLLMPKKKKYNSINEIKPQDLIATPYPILKDKLIKYITRTSDKRKKVEKKNKGAKEEIIKSDDEIGVAMHTIANGKTGILTVGTFLPSNPNTFIETIEEAFKKLDSKSSKIERLIIDVRGNTGGYVCLAYGLAQYLVPSLPKIAWPALDMIRTKLVDEFMGCDMSYLFMPLYNPEDNKFVGTEKPFFTQQGIERERGGKTSTYSRLFQMQCGTTFNMKSKHAFTFTPQNLIILTDGTCGSACGFFVHFFQHLEKARVVSLGGLYKEGEMNVASFDGAPVFDSTTIIAILEVEQSLMDCKISEIPPTMPSTASFTVSYLELYPYKPKIAAFEKLKTDTKLPVEFTKNPADFHLWRWDLFSNDEKFLEDVSSYFDVCASWEFKRNNSCEPPLKFKNAVWGNPCINGEFNTTQCEVFDCETGYYLNEAKTECLVVPEEDPTEVDTYAAWLLRYILNIVIIVVVCVCAVCCISICAIVAGVGFIMYRKKKQSEFGRGI